MKQENIVEELVQGFDEGLFCDFINDKFGGSLSRTGKKIRLSQDLPWESAVELGIVKALPGPNEANMPLLVVADELPESEELRERSSRIKQFNFARKMLDNALSNPAPDVDGVIAQGLFVFHDSHGNFRLSLVHGKPEKTRLVWSEVKRQSFYVEAGAGNKTFRDRAAMPWSTFDKLKEAFSVEKLTREFYNRLFQWYQWALSDEMDVTYPNDVETEKDDRNISEHLIRLLTRLMFVWFLKQKHLVPNEIFDTAYLTTILKEFDPTSGDNYYRAILQNLFFATLNSDIAERAFATQTGDRTEHFDIKTFYRYPKEFTISENEVLELFKGIPFLNGGLFECLDRGRNYYDGFSRATKSQARVPNQLFFDDKHGLIPLLSQYNFTVEENSPGDEEVALDPELLGKVFENLLGAYNPETEVAARKATGSFYTPREIVNYMVDESLIAHLTTQCGDEHEEAIRALFADGTRPRSDKLCNALDEALVSAKILDPACGSGAFPMGVLLRMVELLRILRKIPEDDSVYDLKLQLIENCIYGADIQCIAVQISKLRFFISLVCEQKATSDAKKNYGINSLPNLETKFVAANSLIGLPRAEDMLPMQNIEDLKKSLWEVRHKHFLARTYQEKKELRKEDSALRKELAKELEYGGGFDTASAKLMAEWDPYNQNVSSPFLDSEWMFNVRTGFNITIGNPPYVQIQKLPKEAKAKLASQSYKTFVKTGDIYCLFYERGLDVLRNHGVLTFITSNKFFRAGYGKALRQLLNGKKQLQAVIDFCELPVFEAGTDPCILLVKSENGSDRKIDAAVIKETEDLQNLRVAVANIGFELDRSSLSDDGWSIEGSESTALLEKLRSAGVPLGEYVNKKFYRGILTGFNEAFVIDKDTRDKLIAEDKNSADIIKPWLRGQDIKRWYAAFQDLYVINIQSSSNRQWPWSGKKLGEAEKVLQKLYPAIYNHLKPHKDRLIARDDQGQYYWELRSCAYNAEFELPKIVFNETSKELHAFFDETSLCINKTGFIILSESAKYLLGIMNSRLLDWFYRSTFPTWGDPWNGGRVQFRGDRMGAVPIPAGTVSQKQQMETLVDQILAAKKADPSAEVSALENEIDQLVYKLYELTPEEIAIVEEATEKTVKANPASSRKDATTPRSTLRSEKKGRKKTKLPPSLPGWD